VNPRCTPRGILSPHSTNQFAQFPAETLTTHLVARTPAPVVSKTITVPPHYRFGFYEQKRVFPLRPHSSDRDPEQPVDSIQPWPLLASIQNGKLLTKN